ncbi:hypothetical protein J3Q64DRAFT_1697491 [Phycomyces blakesleeanus]|uniref:RdRp catalytic domain-containing protein n=1 Tax=Phycomyces blakesleeanus TaxID=4837 RepID=A0ABR3B2D2_PHYBL
MPEIDNLISMFEFDDLVNMISLGTALNINPFLNDALRPQMQTPQDFKQEYPYFTVEYQKKKPFTRPLDRSIAQLPPEKLFTEFCDRIPPPISNINSSDYVFVEANTIVQMRHLKLFNRPERPRPSRIETQLSQAIQRVEKLMDIPDKLQFPEKNALRSVPFYNKRSSGYYYWLQRLNTREKANFVAQIDAEQAYDALMAGRTVNPHLYRICGKGKATLKSKLSDNSLITGRLILLTTQRDIKLNGITENYLTEHYIDKKYPVGFGLSWWHGGSDAFIERMKPYDTFYCLDAKKFDANIDGWMVKMAIGILRKQYIDGTDSRYDTYWNFIYSGLVDTPIFRDDGIAFEKHVGSTTGHSHNTLVQSIITLIIAYAAIIVANPHLSCDYIFENTWVESLGDDNIIAIRGNMKRLTALELAKVTMEHFGIDWSGAKSFRTSTLVDQEACSFSGVQFLGKYFRKADIESDPPNAQGHYLPYRPASETFLKLLFTTKNLKILEMYMEMRNWLDLYLDWLEGVLKGDLPKRWTDDDIRKFQHGQRNTGLILPDCKRITYEQWVDMVVTPRK